MSLAAGDYINVQARIVATFVADTVAGGLREVLGTWPTSHAPSGTNKLSVNTIETELRGDLGRYQDINLPALVIIPDGDSEGDHEQHPRKEFRFVALAIARESDLEAADATVMKIAHRLKMLIRAQNDTDKQFGIVAGDVNGFDSKGGLDINIGDTQFLRAAQGEGERKAGYHSVARTTFTIGVPCLYTFT